MNRAGDATESRVGAAWPAIVCPADGGALEPSGGVLRCGAGHGWEVRDGIPRLIDDPSTYADAFGLQWNVYRRTQLDSHTGTTLSSDRARRCLGRECVARLEDSARATHVLEVGCGAGRFTEVLLGMPGARVTSVDLSSAVDANQANFPQDERHRIAQADLMQLPFAPGQFDIVFCLGVIQHTPDPETTIAKLYEQVKPGGWLIIDHYTYTLSLLTKSSVLIRPFMKRLSPDAGMKWTQRLVRIFFPLHRAVRRARVLQMLLSRVSPLVTYFHAHPGLSDELQYEWALLDTHDTLTDWYKHLRTRGQIERVLSSLGASEIHVARGGNGVEARCVRAPQ